MPATAGGRTRPAVAVTVYSPSGATDEDRQAPGAPRAHRPVVDTRHRGATGGALTAVGEVVAAHRVPVAHHNGLAARRAVRGLTVRVVDVARVHVVQSLVERDLAGAAKRLRRGMRYVHHLEVRMERGEVQRHIGAEVLEQPVALL